MMAEFHSSAKYIDVSQPWSSALVIVCSDRHAYVSAISLVACQVLL